MTNQNYSEKELKEVVIKSIWGSIDVLYNPYGDSSNVEFLSICPTLTNNLTIALPLYKRMGLHSIRKLNLGHLKPI